MRYFAKENFEGELRGLYRFQVDEKGLREQYWTPEGWHHDDDAVIVEYLALGEGDLTEITLEVAQAHKPEAFNSSNANKDLPRSAAPKVKPIFRKVEYRVAYFGSSLVGFSYGYEAYEAALKFLQEKSDNGKAKCFHWWCETCKSEELTQGDSPVGHFIEVSIPNVLLISKGQEVDWHWEDPEAEWAKSRGIAAADEFQSLVDRKSRPNWKIKIESYIPYE